MDHAAAISSDATSLSSPAPVVFSDALQRTSSPPSSPPGFPWDQPRTQTHGKHVTSSISSPIQAKSAFAILGKRKTLGDISANALPAKKPCVKNTATKPLTQMQISLGQRVQVKCKACGMEYVSSSAEDRRIHAKYHKQITEGYVVGKDFVQRSPERRTFHDAVMAGAVCIVDCHDTPARIRHAQAVLTIVERELGAVPLVAKDVWKTRTSTDLDPPYRAYMYVQDAKCIGYLLAQRIEAAFAVLKPPPTALQPRLESNPTAKAHTIRPISALAALKARQQRQAAELIASDAQPLQISQSPSPAHLGISRIWTAPTHRHQNIATKLLGVALGQYSARANKSQPANPEIKPRRSGGADGGLHQSPSPIQPAEGKALMAFSQPTEAGTRLARRWFGKRYGWLVYMD